MLEEFEYLLSFGLLHVEDVFFDLEGLRVELLVVGLGVGVEVVDFDFKLLDVSIDFFYLLLDFVLYGGEEVVDLLLDQRPDFLLPRQRVEACSS